MVTTITKPMYINPESNKKDKRVFHALRTTKDLEEAKVKQRIRFKV